MTKNWILACALAWALHGTYCPAAECASCGDTKHGCKGHCQCVEPPPADCPDCGDPCAKHRVKAIFGAEHTRKLIEQAADGCCKERIKAVKKLGCCLHADVCCGHDVLDALLRALLCDTCWEVRREAAWAIAYQKAYVPQAVLGLYLASKLDPHFMVRDGANEAMDVLLVCRRECFKELFKNGDDLVKKIRGTYNPTRGDCINVVGLVADCCQGEVTHLAPEAIAAPAPK